MLNRTNRTLSANTHRLNLGTRSLALVKGANMDLQTLRTRPAHPQAAAQHAQAGKPPSIKYPSIIRGSFVFVFPGSSSEVSWPMPSAWEPRPRPVVVAEAPPVVRPVVVDDRDCRRGGRARRDASPTLADARHGLPAPGAIGVAAGG